jgi:NADH-quinone oxidoreductase subunit N
LKEILLLSPEIFLLLTFAGLVVSEIAYHGERVRFVGGIAMGGIAAALIQVFLTYQQTATQLFDGLLTVDGLSLFFKLFFMSLALMAVVLCLITQEIPERRRAEYFMFIVAAALAMCLAASATSLLVIFLALAAVNSAGYFFGFLFKRELPGDRGGLEVFCV